MALLKVVLALQNPWQLLDVADRMKFGRCDVNYYQEEIKKLVEINLKMFAEGFSLQKGAIFGFGPLGNLGNEIPMKIFNADAVTLEKVDEFVQVHKILEERNVGETNYELKIQARENLNNASRKMVLNKCGNLKMRTFGNYRNQIRLEWDDESSAKERIQL